MDIVLSDLLLIDANSTDVLIDHQYYNNLEEMQCAPGQSDNANPHP